MSKIFFISVFLIMLTCVKLHANSQPVRIKFKKVIRQDGSFSVENDEKIKSELKILIAVTIKDHKHSLPTFLATLETLECPNQDKKCDLWVIFDDCNDKSYDIFTNWLSTKRQIFDSILMIDTKNDEKTRKNHPELSDAFFSKNLKIRALAYALDKKFDYIFFIRADVILINPETIKILISKKKSIVAPLLTSTDSQYSTYWHDGPTDQEFEKLYLPIYQRTSLGCFKVFGVQDCYLLDLNDRRLEDFLNQNLNDKSDYQLSAAARAKNILMHVCNREIFGYIPDSIPDREESFTHLLIEHLLKGPNKTYNKPLPVSQHIDYKTFVDKKKTKLGFDEIYVINLPRREDRRERIEATLEEMNVEFRIFEAVDGSKIDESYIKNLSIKSIPDYKDPYSGRSMNYGEIGCFLSHYFIWKDVVEKQYNKILVLEDDARFVLNFKNILADLLRKTEEKHVEWDLIYLGRKQMDKYTKEEYWENSIATINGYGIVHPAYSHWTISYALTLEGAKKLTINEPLKRLLPVDEYLPLMFDKQPNNYWSSFYPIRNVKALAIYPSIVMPTHFLGEPGYVSDTEHTPILKEEMVDNLDDSSILIEESLEDNLNEIKNHEEL